MSLLIVKKSVKILKLNKERKYMLVHYIKYVPVLIEGLV